MNEILLVNPRKRRRKGKKSSSRRRRGSVRLKRTASRRRAVRRVKARRYKRNPSGGGFSLKSIGSQVVPVVKSGALGAVGALANDALVGQVAKLSFLPDALKSGYGKHGLKIASAIVVGVAGNMVARGKGRDLAVGAATVAIHGLLKDVVNANFPAVGQYLADYEDVGAYNPAQLVDETGGNMGEYIPGVGEYIPGMVAGDDDM
jgi:hypothetical protein